jgi:alkylation response protein AidB-like acyl-CoA dehydrogenase
MNVVEHHPELNFDDFSEEVREFQQIAREFARDVVAPRALELDTEAHDHFAWDIVQKGHELGLTRAMLPPDQGGLGMDVVGVCLDPMPVSPWG